MNRLLYLLLILVFGGCASNGISEKHQNSRDHVINVKNQVKEIVIDEVLIGRIARLNLIDDYLLIKDSKSFDTLIYIFNKNDFSYITGTGYLGEGPDEITNLGNIVVDASHREFHAPDLGKQKIYSYNLDSVLSNPAYLPKVKTRIGEMQFPDRYVFFNDTLCIASVITKVKGSLYQQAVARWNMITGEIKPIKYVHPEVEVTRVLFAASKEKNLIVESYLYHDLITICDFDGNLKYNIYGPHWDNRKSNKIHYYDDVMIYKDKIIATYSGGDNMSAYEPTRFLVFDLDGNYISTLETEFKIQDYCIDEENNRIIMALADEMQFAYLDLDGLI